MKPWCLVVALLIGAIGIPGVGRVWGQTPSTPKQPGAVTVVITSDEQTWVSVTKVRQPAKFKSLTLQLRPGVYEIVGRRKGYRDEASTLIVREGMQPVTVSVICTVNAGG